MDHLVVHCEFAHSLWCKLLVKCGIFWCSLRSLAGMIGAWRYFSFFFGVVLFFGDSFLLLFYGWCGKRGMI